MARNSKSQSTGFAAHVGQLPVWVPLLAAAAIAVLIGQRAPIVAMLAVLPLLVFCWIRVRNAANRARLVGRVAAGDVKLNLSLLSWASLKRLITTLYQQRGYTPVETLKAAPEGGVDLAFRNADGLFFVSCKHTPNKQVTVQVVRDLYAVISTQRAGGGAAVNVGGFAPDAALTARKLGIELLDAERLQSLLGAKPPAVLLTRNVNTAAAMALGAYVALAVAAVTVDWSRLAGALIPRSAPAAEQASRPAAPVPDAAADALKLARQAQEQRNYARAAADAATKQLAEDKVVAWNHSFKVTDECIDPVNWKTQVECGNEYMRAKKKFEEDWERAHPPGAAAAAAAANAVGAAGSVAGAAAGTGAVPVPAPTAASAQP